jgi:alpha-glucosidase
MKSKVWPESATSRLYQSRSQRVVGGLFELNDIWVKGVWNDMNESAVMEVPNKTFPMDVRHDYDGNLVSQKGAFMERKWLELPTMGEAFCISKRPFLL